MASNLEWVTFSSKTGICMVLLSNFVAAYPYQNQTFTPQVGYYGWVGTSALNRAHSVGLLSKTLNSSIILPISVFFPGSMTYPFKFTVSFITA